MRAGVAQLVEQLIRNQQVTGSSPVTSSRMRENFGFLFFLFSVTWDYEINVLLRNTIRNLPIKSAMLHQFTGSSPVTSSINSGGKPLFSMSGDLFLIAFSDVNLMPLVVYF